MMLQMIEPSNAEQTGMLLGHQKKEIIIQVSITNSDRQTKELTNQQIWVVQKHGKTTFLIHSKSREEED